MPKEHPLTAVLMLYIDAWNCQDVNAIVSFFADDAVYSDVATASEYRGSEITDYLQELMDFGHFKAEVMGGFAWNNNIVAYQEHTTGVAKNGYIVDLYTAEFIEFSGDKIIRVRTYYDYSPSDGPSSEVKSSPKPSRPKYRHSGLRGIELASYKQQLMQALEQDKLYRKNTLSLNDLAKHLSISNNQLSQVINSQFGMNFFELINRYRVDEAVQLLQQADNKQSVLDIAENLGFNSSSTFYNAFKKWVGMTPLQYRKKNQLCVN